MTKIPLHPDEIRIGYTPAGKPFNWYLLITILIVATAAYMYYQFKASKKLQPNNEE